MHTLKQNTFKLSFSQFLKFHHIPNGSEIDIPSISIYFVFFYLSVILPGKLTENTFSFTATTWGIVTGERRGMNEPIVNWGLLGDRDGLRARLGI